jgi:hypothetical protein
MIKTLAVHLAQDVGTETDSETTYSRPGERKARPPGSAGRGLIPAAGGPRKKGQRRPVSESLFGAPPPANPARDTKDPCCRKSRQQGPLVLYAGMQCGNRLIHRANREIDRCRQAVTPVTKALQAICKIGESGALRQTEGNRAISKKCRNMAGLFVRNLHVVHGFFRSLTSMSCDILRIVRSR